MRRTAEGPITPTGRDGGGICGGCGGRIAASTAATALAMAAAAAAQRRLRCFQRLSLPNIATRQCHWRDNRNTRGSSTPVLSY